MAWFDDLTACNYFGEPLATSLRAVGWLERGRKFSTGPADATVYAKLLELRENPWQPGVPMGPHECDLCAYRAEAIGTANLFIPGNGLVYVCPDLIVHYMNAHHYSPPAEFCEAVLACPPMRSMEYLKRLLKEARPLISLSKDGGTQHHGAEDSAVQAREHCCEMMRSNVENQCDEHQDRFDCPDCLVAHRPKTDEYGLIVHDGGTSIIAIRFCPWCGADLS
jgi:hypothetical protein